MDPEQVPGRRLQGLVKSYNSATGFGFITCTESIQLFQRDVFLHRSEAEQSGAVIGATVSFQIELNRSGKPQARDVRVEAPPALTTDGVDPQAVSKQEFEGNIKSVNQQGGYGFINCEDTYRLFKKDVFVHHSQLSGFGVGDRVRFRVDVDPVKGTPKGRDLHAAQSLPAGIMRAVAGGLLGGGGGGGAQGPERDTADQASSLGSTDGLASLMNGHPADAGATEGSGGTGEDAQLGSNETMQALMMQQIMYQQFVMQQLMEQQVLAAAGAQAEAAKEAAKVPAVPTFPGGRDRPDPKTRYTGLIKSFNMEKGFGFIACDETMAAFGRDVYLHTNQFDGHAVADTVTFRVELVRGSPQARELAAVGKEPDKAGKERVRNRGAGKHGPYAGPTSA